ncbi:MAG TPA: hypothetical protein VK436_14235 [Methanocella sp.]|nr:hypothetical protein [Methanocella sp.]
MAAKKLNIPSDIRPEIEASIRKAPEKMDVSMFLGMGEVCWEWTNGGIAVGETIAWRPESEAMAINGDLEVDGNIIVSTKARVDDTFLIVFGSIKCRNLIMGTQATMLCLGDVWVSEVMSCTVGDSICEVAGEVHAFLLDSGSGAWLTIYDEKQLAVDYLAGYVMVGGRPVKPKKKVDLTKCMIEDVIDFGEWNDLSSEEREGGDIAEYIRLDGFKAFHLLKKRKSILSI